MTWSNNNDTTPWSKPIRAQSTKVKVPKLDLRRLESATSILTLSRLQKVNESEKKHSARRKSNNISNKKQDSSISLLAKNRSLKKTNRRLFNNNNSIQRYSSSSSTSSYASSSSNSEDSSTNSEGERVFRKKPSRLRARVHLRKKSQHNETSFKLMLSPNASSSNSSSSTSDNNYSEESSSGTEEERDLAASWLQKNVQLLDTSNKPARMATVRQHNFGNASSYGKGPLVISAASYKKQQRKSKVSLPNPAYYGKLRYQVYSSDDDELDNNNNNQQEETQQAPPSHLTGYISDEAQVIHPVTTPSSLLLQKPSQFKEQSRHLGGGGGFECYTDFSALQGVLNDFIQRSDAVLEVGCGTSSFARDMVYGGYNNITAIDASPTAIQYCQRNFYKEVRLKGLTYQTMSASNLTFATESFDTVFCKAMLDYLSTSTSPQQLLSDVLKETYRVLKPGGILFIVSCQSQDDFPCWWKNQRILHEYFTMVKPPIKVGTPVGDLKHHEKPFTALVFRKYENRRQAELRLEKERRVNDRLDTILDVYESRQSAKRMLYERIDNESRETSEMMKEDVESQYMNSELRYYRDVVYRKEFFAEKDREMNETVRMEAEDQAAAEWRRMDAQRDTDIAEIVSEIFDEAFKRHDGVISTIEQDACVSFVLQHTLEMAEFLIKRGEEISRLPLECARNAMEHIIQKVEEELPSAENLSRVVEESIDRRPTVNCDSVAEARDSVEEALETNVSEKDLVKIFEVEEEILELMHELLNIVEA